MALYLVTGGAGFIGSHLVEALVERGNHVRVLDNFSTGKRENLQPLISNFSSPALQVIEGDIRNLDSVGQAMNGVEYVLHHAAIVSVPQSMADPAATHAVNVTGTLNVLMAARQANVRRVVLASSCAVYGDNDNLPLKEAAPPRPLSPYAASKLAGEMYCQTFFAAYGLPAVCLRYFNIYGPRQNPAGDYAAVIPKFSERIRAGQPPVIYGDGQQTRDFVHVSDVVRANLLACEREQAIGQVFNIASGQRVSLLGLIDTFNKLQGAQFEPQFKPERAGDIRHSAGDGERIASLLGFRPQMSLENGLRQFVAPETGRLN
jgi:UDP-glucose 4-epimerase